MTDAASAHVTVDDLAAYAAGELDGADAVTVEAHVLLCADCHADLDAFAATADDLATLGDTPVPMPADVAARLDAALAAERSTGAPATTVLPMRRRGRATLAGLSAAAAAIGLVAAVGVGLVRGGGDSPEQTAAGTTADRGLAQDSAGQRVLRSGIAYSRDTVVVRVQALLTGSPAPAYAESAPLAAPSASRHAVRPNSGTSDRAAWTSADFDAMVAVESPQFANCLAGLRAPGSRVEPVLVDYATYEGQPAIVVVLPTVVRGVASTTHVDVWVVEPGCSAADVKALDFKRLRR